MSPRRILQQYFRLMLARLYSIKLCQIDCNLERIGPEPQRFAIDSLGFSVTSLGRAQVSQTCPRFRPIEATRRADRSVAVLVWNLAEVAQPSGIPGAGHTRAVSGSTKRFQVELRGARPGQRANIRFVDQERGSPMPAWREMGSPQYPRPDQIELLRRRADIAPATTFKLNAARQLVFDLPREGVALLELRIRRTVLAINTTLWTSATMAVCMS